MDVVGYIALSSRCDWFNSVWSVILTFLLIMISVDLIVRSLKRKGVGQGKSTLIQLAAYAVCAGTAVWIMDTRECTTVLESPDHSDRVVVISPLWFSEGERVTVYTDDTGTVVVSRTYPATLTR